jgi:cell division protein ZapE
VPASPVKAERSGPVSAAYAALVGRGALVADPAQREAALLLDSIAEDLANGRKPNGLLSRLTQRSAPIKGAYIHGEVGRGKTMLMDLFFSVAPTPEKRRVHFHEFMDEVHAAIAAFRKKAKARGDDSDPIEAVVKPIARSVRLLCLDEFHVHDITNAMLLYRLFDKLFARGVVLVATSNVVPDKLYENGLNRDLFAPFIKLLKQHVTVAALPAAKDYRREKFAGQDVYAFGTGPEVREKMDALWLRITGGEPGEPTSIESIGRKIHVPRAAMGAARFAFSDLCEKPLGSRDFVRIAHAFDSLVIDGVPQFERTRSDAAKRFILLIDNLYDRGVKLAASFAVPLEELARDDKTAFEFERTVSRLIEMQSNDYLSAPHREPEAQSR